MPFWGWSSRIIRFQEASSMNETPHRLYASSQDSVAVLGSVWRGCFFCKSGKEKTVVQQFRAAFPNGRAVAPTRIRYRRTRDTAIEEKVILLPGYVFFEIDAEAAAGEHASAFQHALQAFSRGDSILRLLKYTDGSWQLRDFDDEFAKMVFRNDGNIGVSQAYFDEGKRIRILDGFLKDYEGSIVRVNKKNRTVEITVAFQQKKVSMWLGYELVAITENGV